MIKKITKPNRKKIFFHPVVKRPTYLQTAKKIIDSNIKSRINLFVPL